MRRVIDGGGGNWPPRNNFGDAALAEKVLKAFAEGVEGLSYEECQALEVEGGCSDLEYGLDWPNKPENLLRDGFTKEFVDTFMGPDGLRALRERAKWLADHAVKKWYRKDLSDWERNRCVELLAKLPIAVTQSLLQKIADEEGDPWIRRTARVVLGKPEIRSPSEKALWLGQQLLHGPTSPILKELKSLGAAAATALPHILAGARYFDAGEQKLAVETIVALEKDPADLSNDLVSFCLGQGDVGDLVASLASEDAEWSACSHEALKKLSKTSLSLPSTAIGLIRQMYHRSSNGDYKSVLIDLVGNIERSSNDQEVALFLEEVVEERAADPGCFDCMWPWSLLLKFGDTDLSIPLRLLQKYPGSLKHAMSSVAEVAATHGLQPEEVDPYLEVLEKHFRGDTAILLEPLAKLDPFDLEKFSSVYWNGSDKSREIVLRTFERREILERRFLSLLEDAIHRDDLRWIVIDWLWGLAVELPDGNKPLVELFRTRIFLLLTEMLNDPDRARRKNAAETLGHLKAKAVNALPLLLAMSDEDPDESCRVAAAQAIARIEEEVL